MKIIFFLLAFSFSLGTNLFGQQSIRSPYTQWYGVFPEEMDKDVYISFSLSTCGTYGLKGYSFWRIQNLRKRPKCRLSFYFDWYGCDGKIKSEKVRVDLEKTGVDDYLGYWFGGVKIARYPYNIKFEDFSSSKASSQNSTNNLQSITLGKSGNINNPSQFSNSNFSSNNSSSSSSGGIIKNNNSFNNTSSSKQSSTSNSNSSSQSSTNNSSDNSRAYNYSNNYNSYIDSSQIKAEMQARESRIANSLNQSYQADAALLTAGIGIAAIGSMMEDQYQNSASYMKFLLGLGWENIPIIKNITSASSTPKSATGVTSHPTIYIGTKLALFNNKKISFQAKPFLSVGFNALDNGTNGSHFTYGGNGSLVVGARPESAFKLFGEVGYINRSGDYTSDADASAASIGIATNSDLIEKAEYNYSIFKYGGGFIINLIDRYAKEETYFKPGLYFEKASFSNNTSPLMFASLECLIKSYLIVELGYSNNYFIAGTTKYQNFQSDNKDYFSIRFIKTGIIF